MNAIQDTSPMIIKATIAAPPAEVWKAFTTKEGIESWMVAKTEIKLEVGAIWRTSYQKNSTLQGEDTIEQKILSFDPERMLSFRTVKTPKGFPWPAEIAKTWVVIYLQPAGKDKTEVTLTMLGYDKSADSQKMRTFFQQGNQYTMDELVKKFAPKPN